MTGRLMVFPALVSFGLAGCHGGPSSADANAEPSSKEGGAHVMVKTEAARRGTVVETVEGLGRSEAIPEKLAMLTPAVEGHVHELLVKQGETVKKGQPIVELDKAVALADLAEKTATRDGLKAVAGAAQVGPAARGAEGERAGGRAGQGGPRTGASRSRNGSGRCSPATRSPSSRSSRPTSR